jgi:hypothetical protein
MHISFGNTFEEPLAVIRRRALENPYLAEYYQKCLVSTDPEFIARYLAKTFDAKELPLRWDRVFPSKGAGADT